MDKNILECIQSHMVKMTRQYYYQTYQEVESNVVSLFNMHITYQIILHTIYLLFSLHIIFFITMSSSKSSSFDSNSNESSFQLPEFNQWRQQVQQQNRQIDDIIVNFIVFNVTEGYSQKEKVS